MIAAMRRPSRCHGVRVRHPATGGRVMTQKDQVSNAVEAFFKQIDDGLVSQIDKQSLPFVGALKDAPGVSDVLAAYKTIKEQLKDAIAKVPDQPTEQDAADAIAKAIEDLGIKGVGATSTADAGVTLTCDRAETFSPTPGGATKIGGGIGTFLDVSASLGARIDATVAAELTVAKDGKVTLADLGKPEVAVALTGDLSLDATANLGLVAVSVKDAHPVDPSKPDDPAAHELLVNFGVDILQDAAGSLAGREFRRDGEARPPVRKPKGRNHYRSRSCRTSPAGWWSRSPPTRRRASARRASRSTTSPSISAPTSA
ncbi:hypothetical protein AB5I41_08995 [Sphingomonas sp. MMS24-JH45]